MIQKKVVHVINPFQGYFGIFVLCWGTRGIISALLDLNRVSMNPVMWITHLVIYIFGIAIGLILSLCRFSRYILKRSDKAEELMIKLNPYKISLGLAGIWIGIWSIIYKLIIADIIKI